MWWSFLVFAACIGEEIEPVDGSIEETGWTDTALPELELLVEQDGYHLTAAWSDGSPLTSIEVDGIEVTPAGWWDTRFRLPDPCSQLGSTVTVSAGFHEVDVDLGGVAVWDPVVFEVTNEPAALCSVWGGEVDVLFPPGAWNVYVTFGGFYVTNDGGRTGIKGEGASFLSGWYSIETGDGASIFVEPFER